MGCTRRDEAPCVWAELASPGLRLGLHFYADCGPFHTAAVHSSTLPRQCTLCVSKAHSALSSLLGSRRFSISLSISTSSRLTSAQLELHRHSFESLLASGRGPGLPG